MMDYEQFKEHVKDHIKEFLPPEYADAEVSLQQITKNNDTQLTGVIIRTEDKNITPNIYLESFFAKMEDGVDLHDVMKSIADVRINHEMQSSFDLDYLMDFDKVKDNIICKLINADANKEYLADKPFTRKEDLAVVYAVDLGKAEEGHMTTPITDRLMAHYGLTTEQLHDIAMDNLDKAPLEFQSLRDVLAEMMFPEMDRDDPMISVMLPPEDPSKALFVISNEERLNGAVAILNEKLMDDIAEKLGGDFFVLPSSIHECLVLPMSDQMDRGTLENMVQEVNAGQVAPEERLSDHVYVYDSSEHELIRADKMEERMQAKETDRDTTNEAAKDDAKETVNAAREEKPRARENSITDRIAGKQAQIAQKESTREHPIPTKKKEAALA